MSGASEGRVQEFNIESEWREIVKMIDARLKKYLFTSRRKEYEPKIAWCRENAAVLDSEWAKQEIVKIEKSIERQKERIEGLRYLIIAPEAA